MKLTVEQRDRYARNMALAGIGEEGQRKLWESKVLLIGAGGLGSPIALYLAAAGVGTLGIVDGDVVDVSNLQRQIFHSEQAVGTEKLVSAAAAAGAERRRDSRAVLRRGDAEQYCRHYQR